MNYLLILLILFLAVCGEPLFIVMGGLALLLFYLVGIDTQAVIIELYRMTSAPTLVAIPLFTFAGYILAESRSPERLVRLYHALFGWMPGGLAIVAFIACAFFTAFTGASGVTIIALGGLLYPLLTKEGYGEKFSLGLITTGGSLGLLFPPSLPLILYALIASVNVDALFLAGIIPGIILIAFLSIFSVLKGWNRGVKLSKPSLHEIKISLKESFWLLPLPVIILGGIYGGIFTASEAAAVTVAYAIIMQVFIYRDIKLFRDIPRIASKSMILVGGVLLILGCALGFTSFLIDEQVPMKIFEVMRKYISNKIMFLMVLNIFLLMVGCLMDIFSAIIVVVPLILPIAKEFGVHPIHLGIIFLTNLEIGYATPPVGLNLFISSICFKKKIPEVYRASIPFLMVLILALLFITYFPDLSLWLVRLAGLE